MVDLPARLSTALAARYRLERELGAGGMATVYLAEDLKHHRKVAIKVLKPELSAAVGAERFLREIRIAANLTHPHIVPLHDSGEANGTLYYVMPYIEGESLGARLRRDGSLPVDESLRVLEEVADALAFAHERGVVHRDIKPENVMLSGGHALVNDFGVARAISIGATDGGITTAGMTVGTPAYMAPEQVAADPGVDHRADIYALGTLAYELLAGRTPFMEKTPQALLAAQVTKAPESVTRYREDCPPELESLVMRCLAKEPGDRWQTAGEIRYECGRLARGSGDHPTPASATKAADGIVILPFVNQSADPGNEFFSDGLTEELIADLAKVRALRVISRTSSMQLKGTTKGIRAIGSELKVRYVLEGSVRKAGNSLRITAQLIDAQNDAQLWAEKYSGTMDDVFDLQERVSRAIVSALDVTLGAEDDRRLTDRPIRNVRAFELYLRARQEISRYDIVRGMALLNAAVEIEGLTPPLQGLAAWAKVVGVRSGMARDPKLDLDDAEAVAKSLLIKAPAGPYGHVVLGMIGYERGQLAEAVRHFKAALERAPNDADALLHLGVSYIGAGQNDAAAETAKRFMACDPLSPLAWMLGGIPSWFIGHPAAGLASVTRGVEIDPESIIGRWSLAYNLALVGQLEAAMKHADAMAAKAPEMPYTLQILALVEALSGQKERALERLATVQGLDGHHKFHLAESNAMAGATDRAMALLEQAVHQGFHPYPFIAEHCPFLAPLRGTPRFEKVAAEARRLTAEFRA